MAYYLKASARITKKWSPLSRFCWTWIGAYRGKKGNALKCFSSCGALLTLQRTTTYCTLFTTGSSLISAAEWAIVLREFFSIQDVCGGGGGGGTERLVCRISHFELCCVCSDVSMCVCSVCVCVCVLCMEENVKQVWCVSGGTSAARSFAGIGFRVLQ